MERGGAIAAARMLPFSGAEGLITRQERAASPRPHVFDTHIKMSGAAGMGSFCGAAQYLRYAAYIFCDHSLLCSVFSVGAAATMGTGAVHALSPSVDLLHTLGLIVVDSVDEGQQFCC